MGDTTNKQYPKLIEYYREWLSTQSLYEIESAEAHAVRFTAWLLEQARVSVA